MKQVIIFGTSDFAQVAYVYLSKDSPYRVAAFTVHEQYLTEPQLLGLDVVPFEQLERRYSPAEYAMFIAVGFSKLNRLRTDIYQLCKRKGYELISYISSHAVHLGDIEIGDNCFVFDNNMIQPFVRIGGNVFLGSGNHIGHHSIIEDDVFLASHVVVSGGVRIGQGSFVGVNVTIRDHVSIGKKCVLGAGALVLEDQPDFSVVAPRGTERSPVPSTRLRNL